MRCLPTHNRCDCRLSWELSRCKDVSTQFIASAPIQFPGVQWPTHDFQWAAASSGTYHIFIFVYSFVSLSKNVTHTHICSTPLQVILGDNAYPALKHLLPIYRDVQGLSAVEQRRRTRYNKVIASTRILVEQSIGTLKMRWPILRGQMAHQPPLASKILLTCITLHNFLINTGYGFIENISEQVLQEAGEPSPSVNAQPPDVQQDGEELENNASQQLFTDLLQGRNYDRVIQRMQHARF